MLTHRALEERHMKKTKILLPLLLWTSLLYCQPSQASDQDVSPQALAAKILDLRKAMEEWPRDSDTYKTLRDAYMNETAKLATMLASGKSSVPEVSSPEPVHHLKSAPPQMAPSGTQNIIRSAMLTSDPPETAALPAHETADMGTPEPAPRPAIVLDDTTPPPQTKSDASTNLKNNFGFGAALGFSANVSGPNIVTNATVDANGIVRVNTRSNTTAGLWLESHYYLWPTAQSHCATPPLPQDCQQSLGADAFGRSKADPTKDVQLPADNRWWGIGPFVAAQTGGGSQAISAVGGGVMVGFRRAAGTTPSGFGLGLGYEAIPSAQVLGSEFVPNQKAPVGPDGKPLTIRYENQDKGSLLGIFSVTF
jgi:hypothetical protein